MGRMSDSSEYVYPSRHLAMERVFKMGRLEYQDKSLWQLAKYRCKKYTFYMYFFCYPLEIIFQTARRLLSMNALAFFQEALYKAGKHNLWSIYNRREVMFMTC